MDRTKETYHNIVGAFILGDLLSLLWVHICSSETSIFESSVHQRLCHHQDDHRPQCQGGKEMLCRPAGTLSWRERRNHESSWHALHAIHPRPVSTPPTVCRRRDKLQVVICHLSRLNFEHQSGSSP